MFHDLAGLFTAQLTAATLKCGVTAMQLLRSDIISDNIR